MSAVIVLIVVTSTIGIINPLLIQAVFNKALFVPVSEPAPPRRRAGGRSPPSPVEVSSHAWKVNFCKFTNETRNGLEDLSKHEGLKFLAAVNGSCAGGGYELALACDEMILIDDRSSAVSLPEVPLLGVLPGLAV